MINKFQVVGVAKTASFFLNAFLLLKDGSYVAGQMENTTVPSVTDFRELETTYEYGPSDSNHTETSGHWLDSDPANVTASEPAQQVVVSVSETPPVAVSTTPPVVVSTTPPVVVSTTPPVVVSTTPPVAVSTTPPVAVSTTPPVAVSTTATTTVSSPTTVPPIPTTTISPTLRSTKPENGDIPRFEPTPSVLHTSVASGMESTTQGNHKAINTENVSFYGKIFVILFVGIITFLVIFVLLKTWSIRIGKPDLFKCALLDWIYNGLTTVFGLLWNLIKRCTRSARSKSNNAQEWRLSQVELVTTELNDYSSL